VDRDDEVVSLNRTIGDVEIRHLRAFIAVAEELNFSRAATRLYVSQPALSRQVRSLERSIGYQLLRRSTHQVELTLAGEALLERARRVLTALDDAVAAAQSVGGEMTARMMRLWAPMAAVATPVTPIDTLREIFENFCAQLDMPADIAVRPASAGGVPSLVVGDDPAILYLHGGGYILGSAYGYRPLVAGLVQEAQTGALIPDYRLAPEHPFPAAVDDAVTCYQWLVERGGRDGRVVVAADSSSAGLAIALLQRTRTTQLPMPAGVVLFAPSADLSGRMLAPSDVPTHPLEQLAQAADAYLAGHPIDDPLVSPLHADFTDFPSLLVQCGTDDRARPEAEAIVNRALDQRVDARLELYATDAHVFQVFWSFLPEAAEALAAAGDFVREVCDSARGAANETG
jgi:monoterpene epsilon-lactone hydrolase